MPTDSSIGKLCQNFLTAKCANDDHWLHGQNGGQDDLVASPLLGHVSWTVEMGCSHLTW